VISEKPTSSFGLCRTKVEIDAGQHAQAAVTAPQGEDGLDLLVHEGLVEFLGPAPVGVGKIALAGPEIFRELQNKSHLFENREPVTERLDRGELPGRGDNLYAVAFSQGGRDDPIFHRGYFFR
jgi:hypothetical protein